MSTTVSTESTPVGPQGNAVFAGDQPTVAGPALYTDKIDSPAIEKTETARPATAMERVKAELATAAALETGAAKPPVAAPAKAADPGAVPPTPAAVLAPEVIAAAEAKAKELDAVKAAIAPASEASKASATEQDEFKKDPLAYLAARGIDIGDAVKQALGGKPGEKPTREQELETENKRLAAEIVARDARAADEVKARAETDRRNSVVAGIVADTKFPNIKSAEQVEAAFAEARKVAAAIVADPDRNGRKLTDTEGDALTLFYLNKHNVALGSVASMTIDPKGQTTIRAGAVQAPPKRRSLREVKKELETLAAQGK